MAVNDSYTIPYGSTVNGTVITGDTYAPGSTFAALLQPANGTMTFSSDGSYVYTPSTGFVGTETFIYQVTDPAGQTAIAVEVIRVTPPALIAVNDVYTTAFQTAIDGNATSADTFTVGSTFILITAPTHGTVAMNANGTFAYTPAAGFIGIDMFAYAVTDPLGQTRFATGTITVAPPATPIAADDSYTTNYLTAVTGNAATGDTYQPGATFGATSQPTHGTLQFNANGTYTYTPAVGFAGTDTFDYSITDLHGQTSTATQTVTVSAPVLIAVDDTYTTTAGKPLVGNAAAGDTFLQGSTFVATTTPLHGTITMNANGTFTYTPAASFAGTDTFTYRVSDPTGQARTAVGTIVVSPPELVAADDSYTTPASKPVRGNAATGDRYPTGSVFTVVEAPGHGTVTMQPDGTFTYKSTPGYEGADTFRYRITTPDGRVITASQNITVEKQPVVAHCLTTFGKLKIRR